MWSLEIHPRCRPTTPPTVFISQPTLLDPELLLGPSSEAFFTTAPAKKSLMSFFKMVG